MQHDDSVGPTPSEIADARQDEADDYEERLRYKIRAIEELTAKRDTLAGQVEGLESELKFVTTGYSNEQTRLKGQVAALVTGATAALTHWNVAVKGDSDALLPGMSDGEEMEGLMEDLGEALADLAKYAKAHDDAVRAEGYRQGMTAAAEKCHAIMQTCGASVMQAGVAQTCARELFKMAGEGGE